MASIKSSIEYLIQFPPQILFKKVWNNLKEMGRSQKLSVAYVENDFRERQTSKLNDQYIDLDAFNSVQVDQKLVDTLGNLYLSHRFDLLGSGWVNVGYGAKACGLEGHIYSSELSELKIDQSGNWIKEVVLLAHQEKSLHYWNIIQSLNRGYEPIDWQRDFKSGFRWDSKKWKGEQKKLHAGKLGVDIKAPWELGRLQHLLQLAVWAYLHKEKRESFIKEIICQCLDFFLANPIGMGVHYNCPMEIGIRNVNLLLTFDLIRQIDDQQLIPDQFEAILSSHIYESTRLILNFLENREGVIGNHYIANILGVLFATAYLETNTETTQWLAFALQEWLQCMDYQFFEEGTNFEGSTCYHALSTEMMLWGTAILPKLSKEKRQALKSYSTKNWPYKVKLKNKHLQAFDESSPWILPDRFFLKLQKSVQFILDIQKPSGQLPQFGDNDSGRLIRISPVGSFKNIEELKEQYLSLRNYFEIYAKDETLWDEDQLNYQSTTEAGLAIFSDLKSNGTSCATFSLMKSLLSENVVVEIMDKELERGSLLKKFDQKKLLHEKKTLLFQENDWGKAALDQNIRLISYPEFGLYLLKSDRVYLAISAICNKKGHISRGHVHNDKLSIELNVDGEDLIVDPGTYLYTALPERRRQFRSTRSHSTLRIGEIEQNRALTGGKGLFFLKKDCHCELLEANDSSIVLILKYKNIVQYRKVTVEARQIVVEDISNQPFSTFFNQFYLYSNGYGKLMFDNEPKTE